MTANQTGATIVVKFNKLPALPAELLNAVKAEVSRAGLQIQADAQAKAPVLTGTLRRSIHSTVSENGMKATVGPAVHYGIYVEYGARGRAGRPYMRPAFERVAPMFKTRVNAIVKGLGT